MTRAVILMSLASPWSRQVALGLSAVGDEVHVVDPGDDRGTAAFLRAADAHQAESIASLWEGVASVHPLDTQFPGPWRYLESVPSFKRLIAQIEPEVVLALYGGGLAALAWASRFRPFAVYVVGSDVAATNGARRLVTRFVLQRANRVFVNGAHLHTVTHRVAPKAHSVTLYIGVDTNKYSPGTKQLQGLTKIVCTRGFLTVYNNEQLVRALALLPDNLPIRVEFTAGGPLLPAARRLAKDIMSDGRQSRLSFLDGISDSQMVGTLAEADIYVSMSRSDGTSISLLEAMASGAYPILSDIPPNREWKCEGVENVALVPLDRPDLLARTLARVVIDRPLRATAATLNRSLIADRASSKDCMKILSTELGEMSRATRRSGQR